MKPPRYSKEEVAARGKAIYEQQIRAKVEPEQIGNSIVALRGQVTVKALELGPSPAAEEPDEDAANRTIRRGTE